MQITSQLLVRKVMTGGLVEAVEALVMAYHQEIAPHAGVRDLMKKPGCAKSVWILQKMRQRNSSTF
jgi:hypothetical protein